MAHANTFNDSLRIHTPIILGQFLKMSSFIREWSGTHCQVVLGWLAIPFAKEHLAGIWTGFHPEDESSCTLLLLLCFQLTPINTVIFTLRGLAIDLDIDGGISGFNFVASFSKYKYLRNLNQLNKQPNILQHCASLQAECVVTLCRTGVMATSPRPEVLLTASSPSPRRSTTTTVEATSL